MTNAALIAKLEAAKEGSRELDAHICCEMSTEDGPFFNPFRGTDGRWYVQAGIGGWQMKHGDFPHYTTNLQDAVDLVPEGARIELQNISTVPDGVFGCVVFTDYENDGPAFTAGSYQPALALCIAILKAMETESAGDG